MATIDDWFFALKLVSALGCGLVAGIFFAFSTFVMKALAQQPPAQGQELRSWIKNEARSSQIAPNSLTNDR